MWCAAGLWSPTCDRSDQYPHDNMGSHYVVSGHPSSRNSNTKKLMAGVSYRTLFNALENGGPAGLIYGYLFVWGGVILQALVMAEMASMYVFTTVKSMVSFPFCGCCVAIYAGFGQASATIRTTPLWLIVLAMTILSVPKIGFVNSHSRHEKRISVHFCRRRETAVTISQKNVVLSWGCADKESGSR